jgi:hypothetical protein
MILRTSDADVIEHPPPPALEQLREQEAEHESHLLRG